ncbi:MAG TPA: hypothetical protein VGI39_36515 [Polyangiaceae bacterium]|jgi:HPt (histidine-containing phosphotransfer) domain-containing protein
MTKANHHEVTSATTLEQAKALSEQITTLLGPPPALTRAEIQRSAKLRKGGEETVHTIAALSDKFGLTVPSQPTTTMVDRINQAQSLVALHKELVTMTKHVSDAMFQAQSEAWSKATVHYSMLRRLSREDGSLNEALKPVVDFFGARSTSVATQEKEARGGARKGSAKAKANRAAKRAEDAATLAKAAESAGAAGGAAAAPAATAAGGNGSATTHP